MPIIKSAIKRAKQTIKRRERNVTIKRDIKSAVKEFHAKPSAETLAAAHSEFDTAVKKGLLKKNTVARRKSQLARAAKEAGVKLTAAKKPAAAKKAPVEKKPATAKKAAPKTAATTSAPAAKKPAAAKKAPAKKPVAKKTDK